MAIIKHCKSNIGDNTILVYTEIKQSQIIVDEIVHIPGKATYNSYIVATVERTCTLVCIQGSKQNRYGQLHIDLINNFNHGQHIYLLNVIEAYSMIINHLAPAKSKRKARIPKSKQESESGFENDIAFVQKGVEHITCFDCGDRGHYKNST